MLSSKEGPARFRERGYHDAIRASELQSEPELIVTGAYNEDGGYASLCKTSYEPGFAADRGIRRQRPDGDGRHACHS